MRSDANRPPQEGRPCPQRPKPRPKPVVLQGGRQVALAAAAAMFGWALDLFDLLILLYVAPVVGKLFFPSTEPMLSLAGAYAAFAVTLLVRPLGSALFGSYADRKGRRRPCWWRWSGSAWRRRCSACCPRWRRSAGPRPCCSWRFRLVQGVFIGGVVAASHTIGTESVPERWRGLMSGAVGGGGSALGGLVASLVFYAVTLIAPRRRVCRLGLAADVLLRLLTSIVGFVLVRGLEESPFFQAQARKKAMQPKAAAPDRSPVARLFSRPYRSVFLVNLIMTVGAGAGYYLTSGYLPSLLTLVNRVPNHLSSLILIGANLGAAAGAALFRRDQPACRPQGGASLERRSADNRVPTAVPGDGAHGRFHDDRPVRIRADIHRQRQLCPGPDLPERALPDRYARHRHGAVVECRLRTGRHDADRGVAGRRGPRSLPMILAVTTCAVSVLYGIGALIIPGDEGQSRTRLRACLSVQSAAVCSLRRGR